MRSNARLVNRFPYHMTYGIREGCPSDRHDTRRAKQYYGCNCPAAKEKEREARRRYYEKHKDELAEKQAARRTKQEPWVGYNHMEERSDWVMIKRILSGGPQADASMYDRWMAIEALLIRNKKNKELGLPTLSDAQIGKRVGSDTRTVQRLKKWLREHDGPQHDLP